MNKFVLLGLAAVAGAAKLAFFPANPPVDLQPTSPGTAQTGHINVTGTATVGLLKSQGTVFGASTAPTGFAYGGFFTAASNQGRGFYGFASSPTGLTYGGFFQNASDSGRAVYGLATSTSGFNYGGYFQSASTAGRGILGVAASPTGTTYGVYGTAVSPNGYGVYSDGPLKATGNIAGTGVANQFTGFTAVGPRTTPVNSSEVMGLSSNSSTWTGMYITSGAGGQPYYGYLNTVAKAYSYLTDEGLWFSVGTVSDLSSRLSISKEGRVGIGTGGSTALYPFEVVGTGNGTCGVVRNGASQGTLAGRVGIEGQSSGTLFSFAVSGRSAGNGTAHGVYGGATGTGTNYGVLGFAGNGSTNYAGYFNGSLYATSANSGVKSFMIDHPLDPANKMLTHASVESNERKNIYDGLVITDERGYATVTLPNWFEALNVDYRYQLTVVDELDRDDFVLAKVVSKVKSGRFRIRTSAPHVEVSWQLSGRRHDPTSNYYPLEVERNKNKDEKGKYYAPEAYGRDASEGMGYVKTLPGPARR